MGYKPISFSDEDFAKAQALADMLNWSGKKFIEECVAEIETIFRTPKGERRLPKIVALLDAALEHQRKAELLAPPKIGEEAALKNIHKILDGVPNTPKGGGSQSGGKHGKPSSKAHTGAGKNPDRHK